MAPESASGTIQRISAVTLATTDMAASVAFYCALGFALQYGGAEAAFTTLRAGDGYVNLVVQAEVPAAFWGRIIFHVDDVDASHRRLLAYGYRSETAPADAPWGERYFHLRDPSGHALSIARPLAR